MLRDNENRPCHDPYISKPTVLARTYTDGTVEYFIIGTAYGFLHDTNGGYKSWKSASGARKALKKYVHTHGEQS